MTADLVSAPDAWHQKDTASSGDSWDWTGLVDKLLEIQKSSPCQCDFGDNEIAPMWECCIRAHGSPARATSRLSKLLR